MSKHSTYDIGSVTLVLTNDEAIELLGTLDYALDTTAGKQKELYDSINEKLENSFDVDKSVTLNLSGDEAIEILNLLKYALDTSSGEQRKLYESINEKVRNGIE